jgi:MFS family permease
VRVRRVTVGAVDRILDTRPLREHPAFRRLWLGTTPSAVGYQIAFVAVLLQVWQLTGSPMWVGAIGLARALPLVAGCLLGGSLADRLDRRRLVLWAATAGMTVSLLFTAQAVAGMASLALILALVAAQATSSSLRAPTRRARARA